MGIHVYPKCKDKRPNCNNRTKTNKCIALEATCENCSFYCKKKDTAEMDKQYHVRQDIRRKHD